LSSPAFSLTDAMHTQFSKYAGTHPQRYTLGILPSILGCGSLLLAPQAALMTQWAGFFGAWYADQQATNRGFTPGWYSTVSSAPARFPRSALTAFPPSRLFLLAILPSTLPSPSYVARTSISAHAVPLLVDRRRRLFDPPHPRRRVLLRLGQQGDEQEERHVEARREGN
jgi:hypothetical protein